MTKPRTNPGGRPTKLTPETYTRIIGYIQTGAYVETAAAAAGIHKDTLYGWLRTGADTETTVDPPENIDTLKTWADKDRRDNRIYKWFSVAVETAQAEADLKDLDYITVAARDNWQAAAWKLERRNPDQYGRRTRLEHTGADGEPIKIESDNLEELEAEAAALRAQVEELETKR